jgi:WD40 repeat protein/tetratricopeptide (TPR) repeat protein/predicted Ser/Thr protein kinase
VLGDYELLEELGKGSMGVVFKARQRSADRFVALKLIRPERLEHVPPDQHEEWLQRFRTEAQAAAHIEHEHVVAVYEVGQWHTGETGPPVPFYSMRYIEGRSLAEVLLDGPLPNRKAAAYLEAVARAVEQAHTCGVLHRDLKPRNLLVDKSDRPYVADFGLAKCLAIAGEAGLTHTGMMLGTPSYVSPEQAQDAAHATAQSDVYSLGATLYALLTGRPPFQGATVAETLHQVLHQEPVAPRTLSPAIDRDLETIALTCMHKEPGRRYGSAAALAEDLRRYLDGRPIQARPVSRLERTWRWCRRNPALAGLIAAVVLLLIVGTGTAWHLAVDALREKARADAKTAEAEENAERAGTKAREALDNEKKAQDNEKKAQDNAAETRRHMGEFCVSNGARLADEGDLFGALLWFAEPLVQDAGNPQAEAMARLRLAAHWRHAPRLTLTQVLFHEGFVQHAEFSPDGQRVVTASSDQTARVWEVATGMPVGPSLKHRGEVLHAAFSPDGRWVVTASADQTARVWNAATGQPLSPPLIHQGQVLQAAFSPDGRRVVTASLDNTARVWEAATGQPASRPFNHQGAVVHATFSPDGRWVATASRDASARVWEAATGQPLCPPLIHQGQVLQAAFSPGGRRVVTACLANTARVWEAATGQPSSPPLIHEDPVSDAAFSPNGRWVVTASGHTARVWEAATGQPLGPPLNHHGFVAHAAFSPDGRRVVTASWDHTARVWEAATGQPLCPPLLHQGLVAQAAFSPDGRRVVTASHDRTARVWEMTRERISLPLKRWGVVRNASFSPDLRWVVTASQDGTARVCDAVTGRPACPPLTHRGPVHEAAFSPDGRRVVTASQDGSARVWEAATGRLLSPPLQHQGAVLCAAFSPDGRLVVSASHDGTARVWQAATGQPLCPPLKHQREVLCAAFSPDSRRVVTASYDGTARVWEAATGQPVSATPHIPAGTLHAAFSADSRRIVTTSGDGTARVWDVATGLPLSPLMKHEADVVHAMFSPDGRCVVTASHDRTARVWEAATGQPLSPPLKHEDGVICAVFSPDGRCVVTASYDGTARVWEAATGQPLSPPLIHSGRVLRAAFSADGRQVASASGEAARVWDLAPDERPMGDLLRLFQVLSGHRLDPTGAYAPLTAEEFRAAWQTLKAEYPRDCSVSAEQALAWHRHEAAVCEAAGDGFAARKHLDRLIEAEPANEALRQRRASASIALGDWQQGIGDYSKLPKLESNLVQMCEYASVLLLQGDHEAYCQACRRVLQRFGQTRDPDELYLLARILALAPQEVSEPAQEVAFLEKVVAVHPKEAWYRHTLAVAYYRDGRLALAVEHAQRSMKGGWLGDVVNWLLLALAHQRLGHDAEARQWLDKAVQWIEQAHKANPRGATGRLPVPSLCDHLEVLLLRREAEALLKVKAPGREQ